MTGGQNGVVGAAEKDTRDTGLGVAELGYGLAAHHSDVGDAEAN